MTAAIHLAARRDVLAFYRRTRRSGESPRGAARYVRDVYARQLADLALGGFKAYGSAHLARYRDARALVDDVDARGDELPFWQTGKVTYVTDSYTHVPSPNGEQSDEALSGECWTCDMDFTRTAALVWHVQMAHNRHPFDSQRVTTVCS